MKTKRKKSTKKASENTESKKRRLLIKSLQQQLTVLILALLTVTSLITVLIYILLSIIFPVFQLHPLTTGIAFLISCTLISTVLAGIVYKIFLRPIRDMIRATSDIAKGNFKVHIEENFHGLTDLGILQRSFNNMARELDGIEMFRSDFINNFSHEFKTPIVSIRGFAHQLQAGGLNEEEQREYIDIIASESDRLANMATNVLLLSKLENQQIVTDKTEFYLDEQLRACILMLEKHWDAKNIELDIDLDAVKYTFNEDMLSHMWINLFGNAIKFTPSNGKIGCTLRVTDEGAIVTVSDTGIGMSEEVRQHIFEKFYQGDRSHSGDGNGIGLTIVGRILVLCNGKITVDSTPGKGSTFTVTLPLS